MVIAMDEFLSLLCFCMVRHAARLPFRGSRARFLSEIRGELDGVLVGQSLGGEERKCVSSNVENAGCVLYREETSNHELSFSKMKLWVK